MARRKPRALPAVTLLALVWMGNATAVNDDIYYLIGGGEPIDIDVRTIQ